MTNKEAFINGLQYYKDYTNWELKLYDLGINVGEQPEIQNLLIHYVYLLSHIAKDDFNSNSFEPNLTEFFIFESDFGDVSDTNFIKEDGGQEIHLSSPEKLWEVLAKRHPEINI